MNGKLLRRRFLAFAFAIVAAFALTACSSGGAASSAAESASAESASAEAASASAESASAEAASASAEAASASAEAASASAESASAEAAEPVKAKTIQGTVTNEIDMTNYPKGDVIRLWLPVPQSDEYQTIQAVKNDVGEITTDELGNQMLYVEWGADTEPADRKVKLTWHAKRTEILAPEVTEDASKADPEAEEFLGSSKMVATEDPAVVSLAEEITSGKTTNYDKARAIYDWVIANMVRDNSVKGCGDGDVCRLIAEDQRAGKCTDINSTFVALCRAAGVPAREVFGIRINADDITGNQHCWASFYIPGTGWYSADPADVLKAVLTNEWEKDAPETKEQQEYYWGNCDEKRVQLTEGRDLTLSPAQAGEPLNNFGYPYAEVDGEAIDYYAPDKFVYSYAFEQD